MSLGSDQREDGDSTSSSSEPKTDRFGFLLVNGDTNNDSDDPCPELVRHREMKWINLISQWDQVLEKKHSKVKVQCQKGIPASVRFKCWPLLCGATQRKQNNRDLYRTLESSPGQQNWIDVINRDTDRQFPFHAMFQSKDSPGQQGLLQVLKAYTQFRPDEGYCQAQGPVAAVLLMHMPMEEAFWCLVQISELYLPGYYSPLLEGVLFDAAILFGVLKRTCPAAYKHMQKQGVEPLMFATDWLMCLYTRHLPFNTLLRVWDLFFCNGVRVLFQVAVVLVRRCLGEARQRKECEGQMETLERLRSVRGRIQQEHADAFIQEVCSVPLSMAELQRQTEKELEKWRKEHPNSTFDPRDRCHGYYTIWEKGKEKVTEKKERHGGNLRAPVMRSHSTLSPAILRKKWRKRGSKTETAEWEEKGLIKQDSEEEERRRASVCGVAGELRAKTPQEFSSRLQTECNTHTQRTPIPGMGPVTHSHDTVFKEDEDDEVVIVAPPHTDGADHKEETAGLKAQTVNIPQETEKQHNPETQEEEEKRPETFRDHRDEDTQTQPHTQHQKSQENKSQQEEETWKPEEDKQPNINTQEQEVNIIQQEVEEKEEQKDQINSEQKQEEELEMDGSKQEEELEMDGSKQEEELEIGSTKEEAIYSCDIQEMGIKTKRNEHAEEVKEGQETKLRNYKQEVEQEEEQEIKTNSSEQKEEEEVIEYVEVQEANKREANSSEQETENQEEKENKTNKCEQEIKIQEVEVEDGDKQANSVNEEEKLELCLMRTGDLPTDEQQQQQEDGKQITGVEPTLKKEEEKPSKVLQTPEDQENAEEQTLSVQQEEHVKADFCERRNKADVEKAEKDEEPQMCDAPEKETEETITEEEIRCGDDLTVDQEASETMEQSGESETSQETKDEIVGGNNISKPEPKDPVPPQLDEKNEEAELGINITTESNPVRPPSGANQHPQLRLRRSSSSYASYPTILSEDTFRDPQQSIKRGLCPQTTGTEVPKQAQSSQTEVPQKPEQKAQKPKRRGLFQRLRAETPSKSTIPKIIIQDFSEGQEKLSSKERRRRRRMQERKEKEEEKERKKLEKELEKEKTKERKKPQTRGRSFQGLSRKHDGDDDDVFLGRSNFSQTEGPRRTSYSDRYF